MSKFSTWRKMVSGLTIAILTTTLLPLTSLAAPTITLVSETTVADGIYDLVVTTTEVPADGKVQYKKIVTPAWTDLSESSTTEGQFSAENIILVDGDTDLQVRIADNAGVTLKEETFTVTFNSNFTVTSSQSVSASNKYTLYVTVDQVPFLGKAQYAVKGGVFLLWTDLTNIAGGNYKAEGITLQEGVNTIYLRTVNAGGTMQTQQGIVVNYAPYGLTLQSDATATANPYTLKLRVNGFPDDGVKVQYQFSAAAGALNSVPLWADMELDPAGFYKKELSKLNTGTNKIKVRLLSASGSTLYSGDVTVTLTATTDNSDETDTTDTDSTDTTDNSDETDTTDTDSTDTTNTTERCVHKDLAVNYEFCDAVEFNFDLGTFTGDGEGNFRPEDGVIRAEAAKILNVAQDIDLSAFDNDGNAGFSDAVSGQWYVSYLKASKENGVITGYPNGTFLPGQVVIRAEFAAMIIRALGVDVTGACDAQYASDIDKLTYWGESACYLVKNDLIDLDGGKFNPLAAMTREDVARLIFAAKDLI